MNGRSTEGFQDNETTLKDCNDRYTVQILCKV